MRGRQPAPVAKLVGADAELGNFVAGPGAAGTTGREAARALLREIDGVPGRSDDGWAEAWWPAVDPQDVGRRFLPTNGGCVYIDLDHLEVCTPEVRSARDFVAAWHAMLGIACDALKAANTRRPVDRPIVVLVNSSDGFGNAYGNHLSFLVTRRLWDELFCRKVHPGLFVLAAHQVSSIVLTGQGKVGAENGRPPVAYQIGQRADFFDCLVGPQTTHRRPIANSRDEALCGEAPADLARLHCIFFDATLCHVATLLKVGCMQIVLAMLEAGRLGARLMLDDPVTALQAFSHDPWLGARVPLADGRRVSAVELQSLFCEHARAYVAAGGCEDTVPGAAAIVDLWEDSLGKLARRDLDALAPRLDWVLKWLHIERALASRGLDWSSPQAKHLDHLYSSLDPGTGLYWALEAAGLTEPVTEPAAIERLRRAPPPDTRARARALVLRSLPRERIRAVNWDRVELTAARERPAVVLHLPDPRNPQPGDDVAAVRALGATVP